MFTVTKKFEFEASHKLDLTYESPCQNLHGHSYKVEITISSEKLDENGIMLINAITLNHLSSMIHILNEANIEFDTHSISLTTYKGKLNLVEPERQLFQLKVYKK